MAVDKTTVDVSIGKTWHRFETRRRAAQRGAALVIGLTLLMVLTVLAISTMRTASLSLLIAGNTQYRENAFQLAQAGIDTTLRAGAPALAAACSDPPVWNGPVTLPELGGEYRTRVCFRGRSSIREGFSFDRTVRHYEVTADATAGRDARARLVQGFATLEAE